MREPKYQVYTTNTSVTIRERGVKGTLEFGVGGPVAAHIVGDLCTEINMLESELARKDAALEAAREETDEFNAGYEAFKAGLDLEDAERTYVSIHYEIDVPNYDVFSVGYAWAKFQAERDAASREQG